MAGPLPRIAALAADPPGSAGTPVILRAVTGAALATVDSVPPLAAQAVLETVTPGGPPPDELFTLAGKLFSTAELDGLDPPEYARRTALATGLPVSVLLRGLTELAEGLVQARRANAAELPAPVGGAGYAVRWVRRAPVLAVVAASNHPEPHLVWVRALALGFGVVVRPGSRDPFTPMRLARALLGAGLPGSRLAILPGDHRMGDQLLKAAPLGVVYGGADTQRRWGGRSGLLVRGPGRAKAALCGPAGTGTLAHLARSVAHDGGVRCTNTSVIRTAGDPARLADALAQRLAGLPPAPVVDAGAQLPAMDSARAEALRTGIARLTAAGFTDHSSTRYGGDPLVQVADGSWVARPVVLSTGQERHPLTGTELPFPFAVVAPWRGDLAALRESLVLNLIGAGPELVEGALLEPTIRAVTTGPASVWPSRAGLPHDGSLTGFLMEPKALVSGRGGADDPR